MRASGADLVVTSLHPGSSAGDVLILDEPLSLYGGVSLEGTITKFRHPQDRESVTGKLLALPAARGSSSSASVLAELIRAGTAPAALILVDLDSILVVGALVAAELYGVHMPIVQVTKQQFVRLTPGRHLVVAGAAGGQAHISPQ